jgi:myosin heavy subunit
MNLMVENFRYLSSSSSASRKTYLANVADDAEFEITRFCLASVGIDSDQQLEIFRLLVAIIHLGNITFIGDDENAVCGISAEHKNCFKTASRLLGVGGDGLLTVLSKRKKQMNGSVIVKTQTLLEVRSM